MRYLLGTAAGVKGLDLMAGDVMGGTGGGPGGEGGEICELYEEDEEDRLPDSDDLSLGLDVDVGGVLFIRFPF